MPDLKDLIDDLMAIPDDICQTMLLNADPVVDAIVDGMENPDNAPEHPEGFPHTPGGDPTKPADDGTRFDSGDMAADVQAQVDGNVVLVGNISDGDVAQGQDLGWGGLGTGTKPFGAVQESMQGAGFYDAAAPVMEDMIDKTLEEVSRR